MNNPDSQASSKLKSGQKEQPLGAVSPNIQSNEIINLKTKKMTNNQKKRQKNKQKKKRLEQMVRKIYSHTTTFKKSQEQIKLLLQVYKNEDHFYTFINQTIREEVQMIADQIHSIIANVVQQFLSTSKVEPRKIRQLSILFDSINNPVLRQKNQSTYSSAKLSGQKVNKSCSIICTYRHSSTSSTPIPTNQQDFEQICLQYFKQLEQKQKQFKRMLTNVLMVLQIVDSNPDESENQTQQEFMQSETQKIAYFNSEAVSDDDNQEKSKNKKNKKKNKKKALKQRQKMEEYKQMAMDVIRNLKQMQIYDNERSTCYATTEDWLQKIKQKIKLTSVQDNLMEENVSHLNVE